MTKALFFDIDGTLVSFDTHRIPHSTVEALEAAKRHGVKIYISTGRPLSIINNLGAISHLIDGYITTNGAYCFCGREEVSCNPIPKADIDGFMQVCRAKGHSAMIVGKSGFSVLNENNTFLHIFRDMLDVRNIGQAAPLEDTLRGPVLQLTPIVNTEDEAELMRQMPGCISGRWYPAFTDITAIGSDKGQGLEAICRHTGIDISESMAFGDGGNDVPILRRAGIGVAMGNANPEVQAAADYVTETVDNDGVALALRHFDVI